jgi:general secretion pathway protein J
MKRHHAPGFTLVEVLVAMLIMAIMAVMAWQGVDGIVRTRNASQARLEQILRLNTVIAQWDQDLAAVEDSRNLPQAIKCDGSSVRIVRRADDGLQIVTWTYRPTNEGGTGNWVRWASPPATTAGALQENWLRSLQLQGGEPGSVTALTGLTGWQIYFYLNNGWANCQSSGDTTSSGGRTELPKGVRAVLSFAPGIGTGGDLTRDTPTGP